MLRKNRNLTYRKSCIFEKFEDLRFLRPPNSKMPVQKLHPYFHQYSSSYSITPMGNDHRNNEFGKFI